MRPAIPPRAVAAALDTLRDRRNLSAHRLARLADLDPKTVYRMIEGQALSWPNIAAVLAVMGCTLHDLADEVEPDHKAEARAENDGAAVDTRLVAVLLDRIDELERRLGKKEALGR